jgi:hypothetical protein
MMAVKSSPNSSTLAKVVVLGQKLAALERRHARIGHDVRLEVQHALYVAQRHVEHHAQP